MPDVPKIVHQRLRATMPEQPHPEADVLIAFAEQALSASERDGILQHLALCGDCRDVIALALPVADLVTSPVLTSSVEVREKEALVSAAPGHAGARLNSSQRRKPRFAWAGLAWANLRWAALAAGIAVAVLVVRPALEHTAKTKTKMPAVSAVSQPSPETKPAGTSEVANWALPKDSEVAKGTEAPKSTADTKEKSGISARVGVMRRDSAPAAGTAFGLRASGGRRDAADKDVLSKSESDQPALSGPAAPGTASEAVAVEAAAAPSSTLPSTQSDESVIARNEMPALQNAPDITKAKPALDEVAGKPLQDKSTQKALPSPMVAGTSFAALVKQSTNWAIADGTLKRSSDGGQTWKAAMRAEHALLCFTSYGQEMWAGGQEGTVLHSTDNGVTWNTLAVSFQGQPLNSAVTHIDAASPTQITLTTDNHEIWSSADGGRTWEKK